VSYRFLTNECEDCSAFKINRQTGEITAAQMFDPGEVRSYILRVVAEDGAPSSSGTGRPNRSTYNFIQLFLHYRRLKSSLPFRYFLFYKSVHSPEETCHRACMIIFPLCTYSTSKMDLSLFQLTAMVTCWLDI